MNLKHSVIKRINDYTIQKQIVYRNNEFQDMFLVLCAGTKISRLKTKEEAAELVLKLAKDPWHLDRIGYKYKKNKPKGLD